MQDRDCKSDVKVVLKSLKSIGWRLCVEFFLYFIVHLLIGDMVVKEVFQKPEEFFAKAAAGTQGACDDAAARLTVVRILFSLKGYGCIA